MADPQTVGAAIDKALQMASRCAAQETSDNYGLLEDEIGEVESLARETIQSTLDISSLLGKLQQARPLTPGDLKTLELLIVGDAESYIKYETEFPHWKNELQRALDEITRLGAAADQSVQTLMQLRALCREAEEALTDIVFYLDAKERMSKFQEATRGPIDAEGYHFLADIVRQMFVSDKM
ncbi:MAG TPA: hypothetical protein VLW84_02945 [Terriglobales bacterium]|nr:hypothetical protein [Terriglobales bacterium]